MDLGNKWGIRKGIMVSTAFKVPQRDPECSARYLTFHLGLKLTGLLLGRCTLSSGTYEVLQYNKIT